MPRLTTLILAAALTFLQAGMAWSSTSTTPASSAQSGEERPVDWAQLLDKRFNLYQMQPNLYRSALPDSDAQTTLDDLGVTTVINFYLGSDSSWLQNPNVQQIHLPFHSDRVDDTDIIAALSSIHAAQQRGSVLIHCKHGQNRTGLISAMYRVVYQGWSKEQALTEMREGGFGGERRLGDAEEYLQQVDVNQIKTALQTGACSTSPWAWCAIGDRISELFQ